MRLSFTRVTAGLAALAATTAVLTIPTATATPGEADRRSGGKEESAPLVVGHRGASGYRPEHTLASYELAIRLGADYVEPDLVSTKDGVLVARHENEISGTTDVASHPEFADRRVTKVIDGLSLTGWFTEDFTLAELKTLRAIERIPDIRQENTIYNGRFEVPTLQEVIDLVKDARREHGREIGIYPETKHPTYFDSIGLSLEEPLVRTLKRNGLDRRNAKVYVQSFETGNLQELDRKLNVPIVQLVSATGAPYDLIAAGDPRTYADLITPAGLAGIARYAAGLGPEKSQVIPRDAAGNLGTPTALVNNAHAAGLVVHPYTFRNENMFLPANLRKGTNPADYGDALAEYEAFLATGIDGLFSDNADTARLAVDLLSD